MVGGNGAANRAAGDYIVVNDLACPAGHATTARPRSYGHLLPGDRRGTTDRFSAARGWARRRSARWGAPLHERSHVGTIHQSARDSA